MIELQNSCASVMQCQDCGTETERRAAMQKFCIRCSEARHGTRSKRKILRVRKMSDIIKAGQSISRTTSRTAVVWEPPPVNNEWLVSFKIPFSQAASKNHVWSLGKGGGHVFKRQESRALQELIALKAKMATKGIKVVQNKIWVKLFVQKPHHRGDAINVVDVVCDGLKVGLGVDDRWFSIDGVDWEISKNDPQIYITVSQRDTTEVQACSHCGRLLAFSCFGFATRAKQGISRACKECRSEALKVRIDRAVTE